uniref:malonyl-coenzyme A:anthocyanin 3-O-glucoside-6''-O-malonyltransferase-like n=1 Tax=Erigeron canadensis TaxID=72917 RepID=UPI001CB922A2|nr:malonyl-coenzyme A:anthocyanin 3-O-glucoside-6''-O-malonyltransferase-like [Erigeron canadensis]
MASLPDSTVIERSRVSPPPATIGDKSLSLTFSDFLWLRHPPVHYLFFYELSVTETQFVETFVPRLKHSLSTTLQYFYPFAGNLIVFPTPKPPEIRYVEGDSVEVTFTKSDLDFNELTGNHPRNCDKFYHLMPLLGEPTKTSNYLKIPLFSVQVTLFPHHGISIGMTNHHSLGDASTRSFFLKAWTSIAKFGTDETFLANGTLPVYDRLVQNPKLDENYLRFAKIQSLYDEYTTQSLSGPNNKLRAAFILTKNVIDELKRTVSTQLPTLSYVSSFTVTCAYIWSCIAKVRNDDESQIFGFAIDCRTRIIPPVPAAYFGNCLGGCMANEKTSLLKKEKQGFLEAAKLIGESLHKALAETGGIVTNMESLFDDFLTVPTIIGVAGTPKLKVYDMDFGWGDPKKVETISIDYSLSISMNACRESNQDLEIGISLLANEMEDFVRVFHDGLKTYV